MGIVSLRAWTVSLFAGVSLLSGRMLFACDDCGVVCHCSHGCGCDDSIVSAIKNPPPTPGPTIDLESALGPLASASTVTVHVFSFDFSTVAPPGAIVDPTINVGDTIHWVWDGGLHSVTSVSGSAESFNSGIQSSGTFDHTFTHAGTFWYYCSVHGSDNLNGTASGMSGTITVLAPEPALGSIALVLLAGLRWRRK